MAVEHLDDIVLCRHILGHLRIDHLALGLALIESLLHHARTHRGHLRAVLRIDDRGDDVATEGGTNLIEESIIVLSGLAVVEVADLQFGTVGGQSARQRRRHARSQVASDDRGAHQGDLRLLLLEEVDQDVGMGSGGVGEETLAVEDKQFVHTIRQDLLLDLSLDVLSGHDGVELHALLIGQFAALGEQLL